MTSFVSMAIVFDKTIFLYGVFSKKIKFFILLTGAQNKARKIGEMERADDGTTGIDYRRRRQRNDGGHYGSGAGRDSDAFGEE